jgi:hypothetical protein
MTAAEPQEQPTEEELPEPSRIAGGCVLAVAAVAAGATAYAVPEVGYFVAGLLATATVRKARGWTGRRRTVADEEQPDTEPTVDIAEHLRTLSGGGLENVLLTRLQQAAELPDTKQVRALLAEADIRVRGVRTPHGNGPGVHMDDIPPAPLPLLPSCGDGCCCTSAANANANNGPEEGPGEGFRVEPIGQAGTVVHDPAEAHRRQQVRAH